MTTPEDRNRDRDEGGASTDPAGLTAASDPAGSGEPPEVEPPGPRRLYRSRHDRLIAGVCGGLGQYFDVDPVLVRLVFVVLFFASGLGLLAYIVLALVVPERPAGEAEPEPTSPVQLERARLIAALLLIGLGGLLLASNLDLIRWSQVQRFWPVLLIALGAALLLRRS